MTRANEEWRNDPARRQAAADLHAEWMAALDEAEPHLEAAAAAFRGLRIPDAENSGRQVDWVRAYIGQALRTSQATPREASETLIGNMAAFGIGYDEEAGR